MAEGKHAAPNGVGNAAKYRKARTHRPREERTSELETMPYIPPVSTFDVETGSHVEEQVPPDDTRFGRAWSDPEPDVPVILPRMRDDDGVGHVVPGEGHSRSRWRPFVALLLLLIAIAAGVAFVGYGAELWGGKRVPNLVGTSEGAARAELERRDLGFEAMTEPVDDGVGVVLMTDPAAGERVEAGGTVIVVVGAPRIVPEVDGLTEQEARQRLIDAGAIEIRVTYREWDAPEGNVISVEPAAGSSFTSRDVIVLTIAQAFTVPEVAGLNRRDALAAIEGAGLLANVVEVPAEGGAIGVATETDPVAGTKLQAGAEVTVKITAGVPTSFGRVAEYFGAAPQDIGKYVIEQGFALKSGWLNDDGEAQAVYASDERGTLAFTSRPFSHAFDLSRGDDTNDVLGSGHGFMGVRWEAPSAMLPEGSTMLTDGALSAIVSTCGLSGQTDSCDQGNITVPAGTVKSGATFKCVYGEMNGLAWTVLVSNAPSTRAVITCAPRSLYDAYDLSPYGGRICCLVACTDMYTEW